MATTIGGLIAGNSAKTGGTPDAPGKKSPNPIAEFVANIAPYAFIAGFVLAVAFGVHRLTAVRYQPIEATAVVNASRPLGDSAATENPSPETAVWTFLSASPNQTVTVKSGAELAPMFPSLAAEKAAYWVRMQNVRDLIFLARFFCVRGSGHPQVSFLKAQLSMADPSIRDLDILIVALAVAVILSLRVNINDFSLHHFYKNRLVRCYLGASGIRLQWSKRACDRHTRGPTQH